MNYTKNKLQRVFNRKVLVILAVGLFVAYAVITAPSQTDVFKITNDEGEEVFSVDSYGRRFGFGIVPIGSFLPWHKSFANTPALPNGWVECNGQVLNDPRSPYNGQTIPNLNGDNRFLRGNTTSGGTGGSTTHNHTGSTGGQSGMQGNNHSMHDIYLLTGDHTHGISADGHLPPYLDVVWIMRVK